MTPQISVSSFEFSFERQMPTTLYSICHTQQTEFYFQADSLPIPASICWILKGLNVRQSWENRNINQMQTAILSLKDRVGERERNCV